MPKTAREQLSANMAALSYALEQSNAIAGAPLEVRVSSGQRPGPLERRRQDPDIASPSDMSLEYEPGKPLKNFGRTLAHAAQIPLPYNMRQSAEAAEAARADYENQNDTFGAMGDTFIAQMQENALAASDPAEERIYRQYADTGLNAMNAFFTEGASTEQRAAAYATLTNLDQEARGVRNMDVNELLKFKRQFVATEMKSMMNGVENVHIANNDRLLTMDSQAAQWETLRANPRSPEAQAFLRSVIEGTLERNGTAMGNLAQAVGGASAIAPNPYVAAASVAASSLGAYLNKEGMVLDGDTVMRQVLAAHDAMDAVNEQLLPQLQERLGSRTTEATGLGIPGESWVTDRFDIDTPNTERLRQQLAGGNKGISRGTPEEQGPPADLTQDGSIIQDIANEDRRIKQRAAELLEQQRRPTR